MVKTSSKNIILYVIAFIVLVGAFLSIAYAFFYYSRTGTTTKGVSSGTIRLDYNEEQYIDLSNANPVSDEDGLNDENGFVTFNVNYDINGSAKILYGIYVEDVTNELEDVINGSLIELDSKYIKFALEDVINEEIVVNPTYYSSILQNDSIENGGNLLYTKEVNESGVDEYKLYVWISELDQNGDHILSNELLSTTFSFIVNVKAIANVSR